MQNKPSITVPFHWENALRNAANELSKDGQPITISVGAEAVKIMLADISIETLFQLGVKIGVELQKEDQYNLSDEHRYNLLVSALEGGSNYWYYLAQIDHIKRTPDTPLVDDIMAHIS